MPMFPWHGLRDDLTVVSEGLLTATNVSFRVSGELRRRPGLANRIDKSGVLVTEFTDAFGNVFAVFNSSAGALSAYNLSTLADTTLASGLNTAVRGCFAKSNGRLYFTNDFDRMQVIERGDATCADAGIAAPSAVIGTPTTATGVTTVGVHGLRYRYFNSKSLYMSDPSPQLDLTVTGASTLTFSIGTGSTNIIRSTDSKVDQVIIEMTDAGSSTFYRAATVNQTLTGTTVSLADADLRNQVTAARDGDFSHQQPPLATMIIEHRGRLFAWGTSVYSITGAVTVTSGSTAVTTTGATMSTNWAGRLVQMDAETRIYRISAVTGTGAMTISEAYTGTTRSTATLKIFSAQPDLLQWTRAGFPESWNPLGFARRVLQNQSDTPSGLVSHHDVLWLLGQRTMRMLDYTSDPATGQLVQIPAEMGLWNQRCLVEANGRIYGWGRSGAWYINGLLPKHISRPIDDRLNGADSASTDAYDATKYEQFHGSYDPRERCITWFYALSTDTYPKRGIRYDIDSGEWTIGTWKQSLRASTLSSGGSTNPVRSLLADENGYSWYQTPGMFDGVPAVMSGGVVTVATTGATTTVFTVSEALPTGSSDLKGVVLYTSSGAERLVSANTANTITVSSAFAAAPTIGTEYFLGVIPFAVRTKWLETSSLNNKKRPSYVAIAKVPGSSTGKLLVKVYLDYATSPYVWTVGASDTFPDGVSIVNGSSTINVDLDGGSGDGIAFIPLMMDWDRVISVEVTSVRPVSFIKLLSIQLIYKSTRADTEVEDE